MNGKYLRVTIHDNDFISSLIKVGKLIYEHFCEEDCYPTEEQLPLLGECVKYLWLGADQVENLMKWGEILYEDFGYIQPHLEFVDYADIPDRDNYESVYIPMFDGAEVLVR